MRFRTGPSIIYDDTIYPEEDFIFSRPRYAYETYYDFVPVRRRRLVPVDFDDYGWAPRRPLIDIGGIITIW